MLSISGKDKVCRSTLKLHFAFDWTQEVSTGLHDLFSLKNNFERGQKDVFLLNLKDVGEMTSVEVCPLQNLLKFVCQFV